MKVTIRSGYRIAVPKDVRDELQLKEGSELELTIKDGNIILNPKQILKTTKEPQKPKKIKSVKDNKNKIVNSNKNIKIVSNLEKGEKFTRKVYSDCKLVIRTKRSYLNEFCEACKGQLAHEYGVQDHPCKYINIPKKVEDKETKESKPVKSIIKKLSENVKKLDKRIDKKIDTIQKECP